MTLAILGLLFLAAIIHAAYHTCIKRGQDELAFIWWTLLASSVLYAPVTIIGRRQIEPQVWPILVVSGLFEAGMFAAIGRAYQAGDLSVAYPLSRGSAQVFVLLWAMMFLNERPSPAGLLGVGLIIAGLYTVNIDAAGDWRAPLRALGQPVARWSLLSALCISGYSVLDKVGVKYAPPLVYIHVTLVIAWAALTPLTLARGGWARARAEWQASRLYILLAGLGAIGAYTLVLIAMRQGAPVSYVAPLREMSIILGALTGTLLLGEGHVRTRVLAACLFAAGMVSIAVGG